MVFGGSLCCVASGCWNWIFLAGGLTNPDRVADAGLCSSTGVGVASPAN